MTTRQRLLAPRLIAMTATAGLMALPALALAQQGGSSGGGSSMQTTTTQTTPQQGPLSGSPAARGGAESGSATSATIPGNNAGTGQGNQQSAQGRNNDASGGVMAQGGDNTSSPRDGTPGNPPSTATQRAADSVTGNQTPPDATPGNPPGTAAGRAADRALGTNMSGANPQNDRNANAPNGGAPQNRAAVGAGATTPNLAVDSSTLQEGRRASKIVGASVYNENNESVGQVDDIIIPESGTGAPVAVISVGGFLGIGAKLVAVPFNRLEYNRQNNRWTLTGATKESLTGLPTFSYDQLGSGASRG
ncbi:MAG TPA: PRC-barrel domain-containing protein [Crenalkalicoccus sp.]|nr:PRC-barrel domain-containing protein [Crenalkalicoccus sp.]